MTKSGGLGDNFYVHGVDVSGDVTAVDTVAGGPAALVVTGINKSAFERIGGKRDGRIENTSWFNPAAGAGHETFSALPTTDIIVSYLRGTALGDEAASLVAKQPNYDGSRGQDGSFTFSTQALTTGGVGLEWGRQLTSGRDVHTGATNGTGVDDGAATSFGIAAYLHVFAFVGTDVTIKVQESADDGSVDPYADVAGLSFGPVTSAPQAQRDQTSESLAVERWLRVVSGTTGGFTSVDFALVVVRYLTEPE